MCFRTLEGGLKSLSAGKSPGGGVVAHFRGLRFAGCGVGVQGSTARPPWNDGAPHRCQDGPPSVSATIRCVQRARVRQNRSIIQGRDHHDRASGLGVGGGPGIRHKAGLGR